MLRPLQTLGLTLALVLGGCGAPAADGDSGGLPPAGGSTNVQGGQTGAETTLAPGCGGDALSELTFEQPSSAGFSGSDVLTTIAGPHHADWTWSDGSRTPARLTVERGDGAVMWRDASETAQTEGPSMSACGAEMLLPAVLALSTDDGLLEERWPVLLTADSVSRVVATPGAPVTIAGAFDPASIELDQQQIIDSYSLMFNFAESVSGSLSALVRDANAVPMQGADTPLVAVHNVLIGAFGEATPSAAVEEPMPD